MKAIAKKIQSPIILIAYLVVGALIMAAAFVVLPVSVFSIDKALLSDSFVWAVVIVGMLFFGSVGFFGFIKPYILYRKLPDVQAETDGNYLYIHGKKEATIPLNEMEGTYLDATVPYIMTNEFIVHLFSQRYGTVIIDVPNYGKYKLYFIADAKSVPQELLALITNKL